MSFIHPIHIGHFKNDGRFALCEKMPDSPILRPVISRPLDMTIVRQLLTGLQDQEISALTFPPDWSIWEEDGYLTTDICVATKELKRFIITVQKAVSCELILGIAYLPITADDILNFY